MTTRSQKNDNFLNIPLHANNLDRYYIRKSILSNLTGNLCYLNGFLLDIGCGKMPYKEYILKMSHVVSYHGLDIEAALVYDFNTNPDFTWDGKKMPFNDHSYDCALGTEVLEHCPEPSLILSETFRVLKSGGCFFFTVPFLWPLHEVPHDEYRYTPFALNRLLTDAGFEKIEIKAMGGWNASLAQMLGLWLRRSKMPKLRRNVLSKLLYPIYVYLLKTDKKPTTFSESTMITGLSGIAFKP